MCNFRFLLNTYWLKIAKAHDNFQFIASSKMKIVQLENCTLFHPGVDLF